MHPQRQRISLHDVTALRVDINGERVQASMPRSRKQAASAKLDARGNAILARPFVKSLKRRLHSEDENADLAEVEVDNDDADDTRQWKKRRRSHYIPDLLPFLHPPGFVNQSGDESRLVENLPSSDLLKVIHHFASCYYEKRGLLTASARPARAKRRSKEKRKPDGNHDANMIGEGEENQYAPPGDEDKTVRQVHEPGAEGPYSPRGAGEISSSTKPASARSATRPEAATRIKDMYKAFDGSTLLLIGMLLQSHIESRINRPPPLVSEWEDQIREEEELAEKRSMRGRKRSRPLQYATSEIAYKEERSGGDEEGSGSDSEDASSDTNGIDSDKDESAGETAIQEAVMDSDRDAST